jgi:hypothetical protein
VKTQDIAILFVSGLLIWILGTIYYAYSGPAVLETTRMRYWVSFAISPIASAVICVGILEWRRIAPADWASAMLLLAIPGMIGEAAVLTNITAFMPRVHEISGGRYGAFLFATYAVVLGIAEIVTLRARI